MLALLEVNVRRAADLSHLDGMVVKVGDNDMSLRVDRHIVRPSKVVTLAPPGAEFEKQFPVYLEDENARGLVVNHHQVAGTVHRNTLWTWNIGP